MTAVRGGDARPADPVQGSTIRPEQRSDIFLNKTLSLVGNIHERFSVFPFRPHTRSPAEKFSLQMVLSVSHRTPPTSAPEQFYSFLIPRRDNFLSNIKSRSQCLWLGWGFCSCEQGCVRRCSLLQVFCLASFLAEWMTGHEFFDKVREVMQCPNHKQFFLFSLQVVHSNDLQWSGLLFLFLK